MKDGQEWCGSRWRTNPPDGVLCLVATRRTLDINGHCCDYDRCAATKKHYNRTGVDRCLLLPEHAGRHLGSNGIYWTSTSAESACNATGSDLKESS